MSESLHHISLTVAKLQASLAFYHGLGFCRLLHRYSGADCDIQMITNGALNIELFCFGQAAVSADTPTHNPLQRITTPGITHFALAVPCIDAAYPQYQSLGVAITKPCIGRLGFRYCFITDPDNNLIEMVETPPLAAFSS